MTLTQVNFIDDNEDFLIVVKPADISFQDEDNTLGFFNQCKHLLNLRELYPVHRLDKMTSGLVILAKNKSTATRFQQLFEQKQVNKYYLAISDKKPKKKQGLVKGDMAKGRRGAWKLLRSFDNPAISQFFSYGLGQGLRLFVVKPHTGKTHQIRVALSSVGSPILGDPYYSRSNSDRGYLHAYALSFNWQGNPCRYVCPPDTGDHFTSETCRSMLKEIGAPSLLNWPTL